MQETADMELLRQYVHRNSEEAFAALVTRHINMVYSTALRKTGNMHAAEEITQAVFIILAKKAERLRDGTILSGWLYQTARLTSASFLRTEIRRAHREQETYMQSLSNETGSNAWLEIEPLLEDAMGQLGEKERNALALRFFEKKSFQEIGGLVGTSENAAKKRVCHGLEKLRKIFLKRGIASTTAMIAGTISANSIQAAPVALTKSITAVAITKGIAANGSTLTLINGALKVMAWTKVKTATVAGVAVILAAGTTTIIIKKIVSPNSWAEDPKYWETDPRALSEAPAGIFILRPTHFPRAGGSVWVDDRISAKNCSVSELLNVAYGLSYVRTILPPDMPGGHFDVMSTVAGGYSGLLKTELKTRFHLTAHFETQETNVLLLKIQNPNPLNLRLHSGPDSNSSWVGGNRKTTIRNQQFNGFFRDIESRIGRQVIDETGLTEKYDIEIKWQPQPGESDKDAYVRALREQLGLELVPATRLIEILVVEKAK